MKKKIILAATLTIVLTLVIVYFYQANQEAKKKLIATQPVYVAALKEAFESKAINLEGACANPTLLPSETVDLKNEEQKKRFEYLCEDLKIHKGLEENFASNTDYRYFLECAQKYAKDIQQIKDDLKNHYPEDYQALNFKQEDILLKYLKHPSSAYLQVQCEAKAEALYWNSIVNSGKVEDLKFCLETLEGCVNGFTKAEECPAKFKNYYDDCTKKLNKLRH